VMDMKSSIIWDITRCSRLKRQLTFNRLDGVISQKMELFTFVVAHLIRRNLLELLA
jgi:hypothetical protein